jgi:hypothetical protein
MKYIFALLFTFGAITLFAQNPIDGSWKGTRETPNGTFEITYTFKVNGTALTGASKSQRGETELKDGKVDGKKIAFNVTFNDRKIDYTGELVSDNELVIKSERGELKLARVKE